MGKTMADSSRTAGLTKAQRKMVEDNIPLVEHIANRFIARLPVNNDRDDLVQTGLLGLITAVQRFDPEQGNAFSTFAGRRIEGAILDHLRRNDWAPRSVRALERQVRSAEEQLGSSAAASSGRPLDASLKSELGVSSTTLKRLRSDVAKARVDSLDRPMGEDGSTLGANVGDETVSLDADLEHKELLGYMRSAIRLLPERHAIVVRGYFFEQRSMTELGDFLGVTQSRASQLKDEALTMIRDGINYSYDEDPVATSTPTRRQRQFNADLAAPRPWDERVAQPQYS